MNKYVWQVFYRRNPAIGEVSAITKIRTDVAATIDGAKRYAEWYLSNEVQDIRHLCIVEITSPQNTTYVRVVNSKGQVTWNRK